MLNFYLTFKRLISSDIFLTMEDPNIGFHVPGESEFVNFIKSGTFVDKLLSYDLL
jgi:hypothetical protein